MKQDGKQNPAWDYYTYDFAGTTTGRVGLQHLPSDYVYTFYNDARIYDEVRGPVVYSKFLSTPTNQLGYTKSDAPRQLHLTYGLSVQIPIARA